MEHEKLESHPEEVSTTSSVHQVFSEKGVKEEEPDEDMLAGIKSDLVNFHRSPILDNALINGLAASYKGNIRSR